MGSGEPRLSAQTFKVLGALLLSQAEISGADIARGTKLASGTLYPILIRLEEAKWVESHWETARPSDLGRPRRRLYKLTGLGAKRAQSAFSEITSAIGGFAWLSS